MALLTITDLDFEVQGRKLLDGLTLELSEGEIHALLGANGTGKSTLAYLIMGCAGYTPNRGELRFEETPLNPLSLHERAALGITMAWQEPARFEGLRVIDYLSLGRGVHGHPSDALRRVGLEPALYRERAVDKTLSGGERKRIELASMLTLNPRLALLDEPDSGIDMVSIQEIIEVIQNLKQSGATVLLISHREEIARIADRASYLCGGRIVATGDPQRIAEQFRTRPCREKGCNGEVCRD
jgi:Fe-S cluster assembly ATP-binding protein